MSLKLANYVRTTLSAAVALGDATITVQSVASLPTIAISGDYFYLTLVRLSDNAKEIVKVTGIAGTTLAVTRAQDNTSAATFSIGDRCELWVTAALLKDGFGMPQAIALSATGVGQTVSVITLTTGPQCLVKIWLVDSLSNLDQKTLVPPSSTGNQVEWEKVSAIDGTITLTVGHTGAQHTWYVCASGYGPVVVSGALTLGV